VHVIATEYTINSPHELNFIVLPLLFLTYSYLHALDKLCGFVPYIILCPIDCGVVELQRKNIADHLATVLYVP
jgi:hypothetical protein